jgi:hypothetical protein
MIGTLVSYTSVVVVVVVIIIIIIIIIMRAFVNTAVNHPSSIKCEEFLD